MAPITRKQNVGAPWSPEDTKDLVSAVKKGFTIEAIAAFLYRSGAEDEVAQKCAELRLPVRWNDPTRSGSTEPSGEANTFDEAKSAFRIAFERWLLGLGPGVWEKNRDHKRARP